LREARAKLRGLEDFVEAKNARIAFLEGKLKMQEIEQTDDLVEVQSLSEGWRDASKRWLDTVETLAERLRDLRQKNEVLDSVKEELEGKIKELSPPNCIPEDPLPQHLKDLRILQERVCYLEQRVEILEIPRTFGG